MGSTYAESYDKEECGKHYNSHNRSLPRLCKCTIQYRIGLQTPLPHRESESVKTKRVRLWLIPASVKEND